MSLFVVVVGLLLSFRYIDLTNVIHEEKLSNRFRYSYFPKTIPSNSVISFKKDNPILMDAFHYNYSNNVIIEAIFNIRYIIHNKSNYTQEIFLEIHSMTYKNQFWKDPDNHVIITQFFIPIQFFQNTLSSTIMMNQNKTRINIHSVNCYKKNQYYLSMCTSLSVAEPMLVESWIHYYLINGVEHITIYANENYWYWTNYLLGYIKQGYINIVDFAFKYHKPFFEQQVALASCNRRYSELSKYVIYNDVDEFIIPLSNSSIKNILRNYDVVYENISAFAIRSAYITCKRTYKEFTYTLNIYNICNTHDDVIMGWRQKVIAKPAHISYVQIHHISGGIEITVNPSKEMKIVHWKEKGKLVKHTFNYSDEIHNYLRSITNETLQKIREERINLKKYISSFSIL